MNTTACLLVIIGVLFFSNWMFVALVSAYAQSARWIRQRSEYREKELTDPFDFDRARRSHLELKMTCHECGDTEPLYRMEKCGKCGHYICCGCFDREDGLFVCSACQYIEKRRED